MANIFKKQVQGIVDSAGITINGDKPSDIIVHNERLYRRVMTGGTLGLGEAYMDGWWDSKRLDEFFYKVISAGGQGKIKLNWTIILSNLFSIILNQQSFRRAFNIGLKHYDLGNDLYKTMLDKRLTYTCAYWKNATTLDQAQENKLDLVCQKLNLKPGQKILDIGCGWGSLAKYAAEKYGVSVVGITVSKQQADLGRRLCAGLPVKIILQDYRKISGLFDHIVSLGMFEHVGPKNYSTYFKIIRRCLKANGLFLLQTIGGNKSSRSGDPWMDKYIFPGGVIPSIKQIGAGAEKLLVMEDWHNFGADYDKTLMAWHKNFNVGWEKIKKNYSQRFFRMWNYYLLSCAGSFRARNIQLWQIVFSKNGVKGGYKSIR
jgi:cyclopropane-fatty-acyl-phospholipid synthase